MKKVLTIVFMAFAIMSLFVSCDEPKHEHSFDANTWKNDSTNHWHDCTSCDEKVEVAAHSFDDGQITTPATCVDKEVKTYTCTVCGYKKPVEGEKGAHNLGTDHKCAICSKYVSSNLTELSTIMNTIKAETIVNPTVLLTGEYEITTSITVDKKGLTLEGDGSAKLIVPSTSSVNTVLNVTAEGVTIKNLSFELASKMTIGIITGSGKNLKVENNTFTGKYENNDSEVSRGICLNAGTAGYEITDNTFKNLRQPAYLEGVGKVTGNSIENTRGWVVCQNYAIDFEDNEFVGWNAEDIAIIKNNVADAGNYSQEKCQEISSANNNCRIDQQSLNFKIPSGK